MKIRHLSWANYRRLPDGHINVRDHVVLVGPNDTGKSSIVRALHLCLGMAHGQVLAAISSRDFTVPDAPLLLIVTLDAISDEDRATFPDEITTGPPEELVIALEATLDPTDPDQTVVRRFFPDGGHAKAPTKEQLGAIAFQFVPAVRSLLRELGGASGGAVRSLISGLDLAADAAALTAAADGYRAALDGSTTLKDFRSELAHALTDALPSPVAEADVRVVSEAEILDDPLSGVTVTVMDGGHNVPLAEQSDGIRALSVLTLLGMSHKSARIVAIDEPETHLHPSAQRSIARSLRVGTGQRVLVTHSPCIVGEMNPIDIVVFRADRQVRQLPPGSPIAEDEATVRHWSYRLIEPLTARTVVAVEGISDRILVERVATLTGMNLDRMGVAIFDLGGSGLFPLAFSLFGPPGFDLPFFGLTDEDARVDWAAVAGVPPADLETAGYIVCDPDLERVYIDTFGVDDVLTMLLTSPSISERSLLDTCGVATLGAIDRDALWAYCRKSKNKVASALAIAKNMDHAQALSLAPLNAVLQLVE
jgi:putative ATP-dependent endonuclease of OLD family